MRRRTLLQSMPLGMSVAALGACGFELRVDPTLPFERIALEGFAPRSPLADEIRKALERSVQVAATPSKAEVVLQAINDLREKSVVASTAAGQVREVRLRVKFEFKLTTPGGRVLIPATELLLARDMSYSESIALAKEQEEAQLYRSMQSDVVAQLMRRLARVKGV
jgi:LPS-assembly lipoprotein